jgi:hypothetical protein
MMHSSRRRWLAFVFSVAALALLLTACPKPHPQVPTPPPPTPEATATPSPEQTPSPTPAQIGFALMFGGVDRYITSADAIETWPSHAYPWNGRDWPADADQIPNAASYADQMAQKAKAAVDRGMRLWVCLGRERDIDPLPVLDALKPYAQYVDRWDVGDEVPSDKWNADRMEAEISWIRGLLQERGYRTDTPFGAIFAYPQVVPEGSPVISASSARVASTARPTLEGALGPAPMGHTLPPGWSDRVRAKDARPTVQAANLDIVGLEWLISADEAQQDPLGALRATALTQLAHVPAGKGFFVVVQAYSRNGSITNPEVVPSLWPLTFELAKRDGRCKGWQAFSDGRGYGMREQINLVAPGSYAKIKSIWEIWR